MIAISLLIFEEVVPSSITGVVDLLTGANLYFQKDGKSPVFAITLAGNRTDSWAQAFSGRQIRYATIENIDRPDLIIIPSFSVNNPDALGKNQSLVTWIGEMHQKGAEVASLCVGSYFLAEAGLLDGREMTSHWAVIPDMQRRYPHIKIKSDLVITDQQGIYTSGGAFSSLKLVLYLIEKFCGRETALWVSKMYAIEMDRSGQAHFAVFTGQHQHEDKEILEAQRYLEQHYQENISMDDLAARVNMGIRNFSRRFKAATNNTPFEYLQRVRMESAKKAIEMNDKDLSSITYDSGYNDFKTFRTIFKRITGLSPQEYKKKYARTSIAPEWEG